MALLGGIEAGGTKFVCAVGTGPDDIRARARIDTMSPDETLCATVAFFREQPAVEAIGISAFGPLDLDPASPTWGYITTTPKPGWQQTDVAQRIGRELGVPVAIDTDVNGAALGESRWGAGKGLGNLVYITVGTGLGGGALVNGAPIHGLLHPEMGHMRIPHDAVADPFAGDCPFHGDCLEGLASGRAIENRWKARGETLPTDHPAWELEARYLALGIVSMVLTLSPQRIVVGGSVMKQEHLYPMVRRNVQEMLNGYVAAPSITRAIDAYIVPPGLGDNSGILGAFVLAEKALASAQQGAPAPVVPNQEVI